MKGISDSDKMMALSLSLLNSENFHVFVSYSGHVDCLEISVIVGGYSRDFYGVSVRFASQKDSLTDLDRIVKSVKTLKEDYDECCKISDGTMSSFCEYLMKNDEKSNYIEIDWTTGNSKHVCVYSSYEEEKFVMSFELLGKCQSSHIDVLKFNQVGDHDSPESFLKTIRPILSKIKEGYVRDDDNGDAVYTDSAHTYMHLVRCMIMGDDAVDAFCLGGSYGEESWLQEMPVGRA